MLQPNRVRTTELAPPDIYRFREGTAIPAGAVAYDSIPSPLPGNVVSLGFEATSTSEFGDIIRFASGPPLLLQSVDVVMSSWGCQAGHWFSGDCVTTSGATFSHSITLKVYAVGGTTTAPAPGTVLATNTKTFAIPFRPSASPGCTGGRWFNTADSTCYNGLATTITFDFAVPPSLPQDVIYGVSYNTSHYGAAPIGEGASCYTSSGGCGYDSLNVGAEATTPSVGTDLRPDGTFLSSTWSGAYCDGGAGGTGTFRLDDGVGCWTGFNPLVRFTVMSSLSPCLVSDDTTNKRLTLLADCTTDHTLFIPQDYTFDGDVYTVTAVDPVGGHYLGAVIQNAGTVAHVTNLGVTASGLDDVCDGGADRLRGILLDGAAGSITNNNVFDLNQGASGCQEGNGIEVRNEPFDTRGLDVDVTISDNIGTNYQKTGILVNGSVSAMITDNIVTGAGPIDYIAQNGIQIGFGATAQLIGNTISGNDYTPKSFVACGILIFKAGGVSGTKNGIAFLRTDNTLFDNEMDICNFGKGGSFKPAS